MRAISTKVWPIAVGTLLAVGVTILLVVKYQNSRAETQQIAYIGASWEKEGRMSQADYIKLRKIISDVRDSGGTISDADLDWCLAIMKGAPDAIVRARVMGMLGLLGERHPIPESQKAKVSAAIAPYLNSTNELDRGYSLRAQKAITRH